MFTEHTPFYDCSFEGKAWFQDAKFEGEASFWGSTFTHSPIFGDAVFEGRWFALQGQSEAYTTFARRAHFEDAEFHSLAVFDRAKFGLRAYFERVEFHDGAIFDDAVFDGFAHFEALEGVSAETL